MHQTYIFNKLFNRLNHRFGRWVGLHPVNVMIKGYGAFVLYSVTRLSCDRESAPLSLFQVFDIWRCIEVVFCYGLCLDRVGFIGYLDLPSLFPLHLLFITPKSTFWATHSFLCDFANIILATLNKVVYRLLRQWTSISILASRNKTGLRKYRFSTSISKNFSQVFESLGHASLLRLFC